MTNQNRTYEIESLFDQQTAPSGLIKKTAVSPQPQTQVVTTAQLGLSQGGDVLDSDEKYLSAEEIQTSGLLQEINRLLLHPLGLSLVIVRNDATGEKFIRGICDNRNDPDGFVFPPEIVHHHDFIRKAQNVQRMVMPERQERLGYVVQPLPEPPKPDMA